MKKGLLSILALAVTIVGCQNYDDQFDALNTQISALKSQVEGLSAVQSQITSLSGTLASLQATVNGLPSTSEVSSAIASELAGIIADVEALQAALETVASAEDLAAIEEALAEAGASLEDLLDSSNVYGEDLIVNSQGTLDYAVSLGEKLAIVNGNVVIDVTPQMNLTDVQTVLDNIGTVVEDFTYITSGSVSAVTFNNIVGVANLEVSQDGPYSFESLVSAGDIHFEMSSKVTAIHLDALTTVSSINVSTLTDHGTGGAANYVQTSGTTADAISGTKLAAVKLTSLPYYSNGSLSITMADETSTLDIAALASVDADGDEDPLNLTVENAAALNFSKITEGNIKATNVVDLTGGSDHDGNVELNNVVNVVLPNLTGAVTFGSGDNGSTLETFHAIGGLATRGATHTSGADKIHSDVTLSSQSGLVSAIIDGDLDDVTISGNSDLTSITYTADADAVTISNNSDITAITLGGTAVSISVSSNSDLETLDIDTELNTAKINGATTGATAGTLSVTSNDNLATLHSAFDAVKSITVTGNTDLTVVDFTGTATVGGATDVATVDISGNDLTANTVVDTYEATGNLLGSISDESGISTLSTYVTAAAAALGTAANPGSVSIVLDKIEDLTVEGATSTANTEYSDVTSTSAQAAYLTVVDLSPNTAGNTVDAVTAEAGKRAFQYNTGTALTISHAFNGVTTYVVGTSVAGLSTSDNPVLAISEILSDESIAAADAVGITLGAVRGGEASVSIAMQTTVSSATSEGVTGATNSTTAIATTDVITIIVDGKTATGTPAAAVSNAAGAASAIAAVWNAKAATTNSDTMFDVDGDTTSGTITITGKAKFGSLTNGKGFEISVASGTDTSTKPIIGYKAGNFLSTSDNTTESNDLIITIASDDTGIDAHTAQASAVTVVGATALTASATADYNAPVDGVTAVAATSNASTTNRMTWVSGS